VDKLNNVIRRIDLATSIVSTLAGRAGVAGSINGLGTVATFDNPCGIHMDAVGSIALVVSSYFLDHFAVFCFRHKLVPFCSSEKKSDHSNHLIRLIVLSSGSVSTLAGRAGVPGTDNGIGSSATFYFPQHVAMTPSATLAFVVSRIAFVARIKECSMLDPACDITFFSRTLCRPTGFPVSSVASIFPHGSCQLSLAGHTSLGLRTGKAQSLLLRTRMGLQ
jgi:hypothetical protein